MPRLRSAIELHYGDQVLRDFLPPKVTQEGRLITLRLPHGVKPIQEPGEALRRALEESSTPALIPALPELLRSYRGGEVTIIVDDHTRPNAHTRLLLPPLLRWLVTHGISRGRINLVVAGGTHRPPREEEYGRILGPTLLSAWRDHVQPHRDTTGLTRVGTMDDGFPVEINGAVAGSEIVLPLTDLDYHYFAGVAGGPKQIMPGVASRQLTTHEHLMMFDERGFRQGVDLGILDGNPVYEYKSRVVRLIQEELRNRGAHIYGLVAVMNPSGRLVHLAGGDIMEIHRRARSILDQVYVAQIPERAGTVIMGARQLGLNLYQTGKAFNSARRGVKAGGRVMVLAPCGDGWGNEAFRALMGFGKPYFEALRGMPEEEVRGGRGRALLESAMKAIQGEAMRDFVIGKQKPVDLLVTALHVGWGHLSLLTGGLGEADAPLLPMNLIRAEGNPQGALATWVGAVEAKEEPSYLLVDDPALFLKPG